MKRQGNLKRGVSHSKLHYPCELWDCGWCLPCADAAMSKRLKLGMALRNIC